MSWIDRLLGRDSPEHQTEREQDKEALDDLHDSFNKVQGRTDRIVRELHRVNKQLREQRQAR